MTWSEFKIASAIARQTLDRRCILLVDNCNAAGYEADLLGVTMDGRLIDVEVKISRPDLKADAKKDKWWHRPGWGRPNEPRPEPTHRDWPPRIWKHYYALPASIWQDDLMDVLGSPMSGLLLLHEDRHGRISVHCKRRSVPNRAAASMTPAQMLDIARLANLRMWNAYDDAVTHVRDSEKRKALQCAQ